MLTLLNKYEKDILLALKKDLKKPAVEAFGADIHPIKADLNYLIKNLHHLMRPQRVRTPLMLQPGNAQIMPHPYGNCLVIGPFNYPFDLTLTPACGAIAAGNTVVIKPSEFTPHSSELIYNMINNHFDSQHIYVANGDAELSKQLTEEDFDFIFFTGSVATGQKVMEQASKKLTPVSLELGGKNPCIIDNDAKLKVSAQRIAWAKVFNAGQSCVVPDFFMVHKEVEKEFKQALKKELEKQIPDYKNNPDYTRIINDKHFKRITKLIEGESIYSGGDYSEEERLIAPTIIDHITWDSPCMQEEIFGPVIPIMPFDNLDQLLRSLNKMPKPLALYYFSSNRDKIRKVCQYANAGGISINDTMAHIQNRRLPFGGIGSSGMGYYHGQYTFECFSHKKAIQKRNWMEVNFKYPPYKNKFALIKKLLPIVTK